MARRNPNNAMTRAIDTALVSSVQDEYDILIREVSRSARSGPERIANEAVQGAITNAMNQVLRRTTARIAPSIFKSTMDVVETGVAAQARMYRAAGIRLAPMELESTIGMVQVEGNLLGVTTEALNSLTDQLTGEMATALQLLPKNASRRQYAAALSQTLEANRWRMDRIARTQGNLAYNKAAQALAARARARDTKVYLRWTERVDDTTRMPLDSRVGIDSIIMHGQLAQPGGLFIMPPVPKAPAYLAGRTWSQPPNRPNDRAVLIPWVRGSGVRSWVWRSGRRVYME